jgi:hypothetical protein
VIRLKMTKNRSVETSLVYLENEQLGLGTVRTLSQWIGPREGATDTSRQDSVLPKST